MRNIRQILLTYLLPRYPFSVLISLTDFSVYCQYLTITKPCIIKVCSRLLSFTIDIFDEKCQTLIFQPHFGRLRGHVGPWLMARWKGRFRFVIRDNWTFFAISYGSRYGVKRVQRTCFQWGSISVRPNFCENGAIPCQYIDTAGKVLIVLQLCRWKFSHNETL